MIREGDDNSAKIMQKHLAPAMENNDRGAKAGWYQMNPSKGADYFLKATNATALIIEPEFIEHYASIKDHREAGTTAIVAAINEFLSSDFGELAGPYAAKTETTDVKPKTKSKRGRGKKRPGGGTPGS